MINCTDEEKRNRVIESGRMLKELQAKQKQEQQEAKARGEEPVQWKDWVDQEKVHRVHFPGYRQCANYSLLATYPDAYKPGMAIRQAAAQAARWKANGGVDPGPTVVVPKAIPVALQATLGKATKKLSDALASPHHDAR